MFSIVIPTLNEEKYISTLLTCLKNQTLKNFEVIVVDASSTDKTLEVVSSYKKFLDLKILTATKKGAGVQRNQGAKSAKSDWLIFIDADYEIENDLLERLRKKVVSSENEFISIFVKPYPKKVIYRFLLSLVSWYSVVMSKTKKPFLFEGFFCCKRDVFLQLGGFNPNILVNEGSILLQTAVAKSVKFKVCKDLSCTMHMRRLEKNGALSSFMQQTLIGFRHIINKPFTQEKLAKLYPMDDRFR